MRPFSTASHDSLEIRVNESKLKLVQRAANSASRCKANVHWGFDVWIVQLAVVSMTNWYQKGEKSLLFFQYQSIITRGCINTCAYTIYSDKHWQTVIFDIFPRVLIRAFQTSNNIYYFYPVPLYLQLQEQFIKRFLIYRFLSFVSSQRKLLHNSSLK